MKVRARYLHTDLILLRSAIILRRLDCSRHQNFMNPLSNARKKEKISHLFFKETPVSISPEDEFLH